MQQLWIDLHKRILAIDFAWYCSSFEDQIQINENFNKVVLLHEPFAGPISFRASHSDSISKKHNHSNPNTNAYSAGSLLVHVLLQYLEIFLHTISPKMLPAPPPPPLLLPLPPPPQKQAKQSPLKQIVESKQTRNQLTLPLDVPYHNTMKTRDKPILRPPRRTNPIVWCGAILCLIFSLLLIFFGIATLIIFVGIKPRNPVFDIPSASLDVIYFDSPTYFNGDFAFLANFTNPNRKIDVRFEYLDIELYFSDSPIATRVLQPFRQRPGETRLVSVHLISSLVYLPPNLAMELQKQVQCDRISYNVRATFRVKVNLGLISFNYHLHGRCQLEMTGPPTGILVSRSCRTKR
ncbi:unnamed protein product [Ilex paraguariensis]|uniref:Late embryogenesis abundant protein LEA-2 subgroup domain-containing protein n=1 Tax=Ilex paraguariensis TaxID=185542 RepID=A0ABC8RJB3_9AQUA